MDALNEVKPGVQMTDEQKKALAKSNAEETNRALEMAAKRREQDVLEGRAEQPVAHVVASSVLEKLKGLPPVEEAPSA